MAPFNPFITPTASPNYSGLFHPLEKPSADTTIGGLLSGVGKLGEEGITAADTIIKDNISDTLTAKTDAAGQDFGRNGVGPETAQDLAVGRINAKANKSGPGLFAGITGQTDAGQPQAPVPPAVQNAGNQIETLTQAYQAGKISNTYYWDQMNTVAKQVRAQFPGYRDEVDQKIASILGSNPANAVRASVLNDLQTSQAAANAKTTAWDNFVKTNLSDIYRAFPDIRPEDLQGNGKYTQSQIMQAIGQTKARDATVTAQKNQLALTTDLKAADKGQALQIVTNDANHVVDDVLHAVVNTSGGTTSFLQQIADLQKKQAAGQVLDPKATLQLQQQLGILKQKAEMAIRAKFAEPLQGRPGMSMSSVIADTPKLEEVLKGATARIDAMGQAITDGNWGLIGANAALTKATTDAYAGAIVQAHPAVAGTIKAFGNNIVTQQMFTGNLNLLTDVQKTVSQLNLQGSVSGKMNLNDALDYNDRLGKATGQKEGALNKATLQTHVQTLLDKRATTDEQVSLANSMYSDKTGNLLGRFDPKDRPAVFQQLTSPLVSQKMQELGKTQPEVLQNYQKWASESFNYLYKQTVDDVKGMEGGIRSLTYDPKTNQFSLTQPSVSMKPVEQRQTRDLTNTVPALQKLNNAIRLMEPVLGDKAAVSQLMQSMGVNHFSPDTAQNPSGKSLEFADPQATSAKGAAGQAMNFFIQKGMSKEDAAALVWNFQQESGQNLQTDLVHDNGTGYGIAGYRDPLPGQGRKTALFRFTGTDHPNLQQQLEFAWHELHSTESGVLDRIQAETTPEGKARAAIGYFRPKAEYANQRAQRAAEVRKLLGSS